METKVHAPRVDEKQNIVLQVDIIYTPEEFLRMNSGVFNFAESMRPGNIEVKSLLTNKPQPEGD